MSEKKIIKETVKISGDSGDNNKDDDELKIKTGNEEQQSRVLCGSCVIN